MIDNDAVEPGDGSYQDELGAVLRTRDVSTLRAFLKRQAERFGDARQVEALATQDDESLRLLMHRMTLARADLAHLHGEARAALGTDLASGPAARTKGGRRKGSRQG